MQELVIKTEGKCAASTRHLTDLSAKNQGTMEKWGKKLLIFKEITHHHNKNNKLLLPYPSSYAAPQKRELKCTLYTLFAFKKFYIFPYLNPF